MYSHKSVLFGLSVALAFAPIASIEAQLLPDNTLGKENSAINSINSLEDRIDGGEIRGTNLFHSFKEFNIDNGRSVYFNNPANVENILTRVTGSNQSQILGKLGVLGNANLFLINPNGILFGRDASLDIKGSFVGSSASFIDFADGTKFSAVSPTKPLLTISAPLGLGLDNPGEIRVQGDGHRLIGNGLRAPKIDTSTKGLEVAPGKTIALIGGNIILERGLIKTKSGRIELGSVGSGKVDFNFTPDLKFSYDNIQNFQNIQLYQDSLLDATSFTQNPFNPENELSTKFINAGSIQLKGKQIYLKDNSYILHNNRVSLSPGKVNIDASESLEMNNSSIRSVSFMSAKGADIMVSTKRLFTENGSFILAYSYGSNSGGNIDIKASDSIELIGTFSGTKSASNITTNTFNSGNGGDIMISTNQLKLLDGGLIASASFNRGNVGNVIINAKKSVEVIGVSEDFSENINRPTESLIGSSNFGVGDGGNLTLNTQQLIVKDGGRVDASTINQGAAGSITINAADKIELTGSGRNQETFIPSRITSSADIADKSIQRLLGVPTILTGESGAITINTNQLNINDGASLAVKNDGSGNAGTLSVKANSININSQGNISATTTLGGGGDINLQMNDLILRGNGKISAAAGAGDGGNISIDTKILAALENSDISANSQGSFGGKVTINAKSVLGTQFREFPTSESDITATSGRGAEFNGVVDINTITINPNFELAELPTGLTDASDKIAAGCNSSGANSFTIIGRGGNPENPNQLFAVNNPIVNLIDVVSISESKSSSISSNSSVNNFEKDKKVKKQIIEAQGWIVDSEGNIEFVAEVPNIKPNSGITSQVNCQSLS